MLSMQIIKKRDKDFWDKFAKTQPNVANIAVADAAADYRDFLKSGYLSGQALGVVTGETRESVNIFQYRRRKGQWAVRPGVGIRGSLNYLKIFERGGGEIIAKRGDNPFLYFDPLGGWTMKNPPNPGKPIRKRVVMLPGHPFMAPSFAAFRAAGSAMAAIKKSYDAWLSKTLARNQGGSI